MNWKLDKERPICPQICEQICVGIASGELKKNSRLMSVREVALAANVNPNTVQKAFEQLENTGLITSVRGSGWFVNDDTSKAAQSVESIKQNKTAHFFSEMRSLGMTDTEIINYTKEWNE